MKKDVYFLNEEPRTLKGCFIGLLIALIFGIIFWWGVFEILKYLF